MAKKKSSGWTEQQERDRQDQIRSEGRQHDRRMAEMAHQQAVQMQQLQAAENQKARDFEKKQSAVERASTYMRDNMKDPADLSQDQTGGAATKYANKFGNGNSYVGKGFREFDFTGNEDRVKPRKNRNRD